MGLFDGIKNATSSALDEVAKQRASSQRPASNSRNSISPDRDLLLRVAAGGEGGAQGLQAQRDAQFQQDSAVRQAAETGRFPLDLNEGLGSPGAGSNQQVGGGSAVRDRPAPLDTSLGAGALGQLNVPGQPAERQAPSPGSPEAVASDPFSTDEDIGRALLGVPQDAEIDILAVVQTLDSKEQQLFFSALDGLLDFQNNRTAQAQQAQQFAAQQQQLELQNQQAQEDRFARQLLTASQLMNEGVFTPAQIQQATGVDISQFQSANDIDAVLTDLEEKKAQTTRALEVLDLQNPARAGLGSGGAAAGLSAEEDSRTLGEFGKIAAGTAIAGPLGFGFGVGATRSQDRTTLDDVVAFERSPIGQEITLDIQGELEAGTPFADVAKTLQEFGRDNDVPDEIVRALINDWAPAFAERTNALSELLNDTGSQ